ncbi:MAG: Coenzyme F420 hydrogenase/dehydrogenase, beta subunit C-terminal domain [Thiomicrorhabdus sp.]|jgi:coenzyme F420 hydrogenase subunit beta|nr:Coenzyme F420 hydrogenase/dehydrogenase, beta subunit C-terminal domain [Thiomicrorhabdus sp.]
MANHINVSVVVAAKLCNTCGGCKWVCPINAIVYQETVGGYLFPYVNEEICTMCGLCVTICPGICFGASLVDSMPENPFIGQVLRAFTGIAADPSMYKNSQSGGIVTALLASALARGEIGGVVTVVMDSGCPPRPRVRLARSIEEIIEAQKSKYGPVPLLSILNEVEVSPVPVAVVGLPCQLHGLHNIIDCFPRLKKKVAFTVGLVCDRIMTNAAVDYLVDAAGMSHKAQTLLHFRDKSCGGYPGNVRVVSSSGESVSLPALHRMRIKDFFTPARCLLCFDKMNISADIVVGDPHGVSGVDRENGESLVLVRTSRGQDVVHASRKSNDILLLSASLVEIIKGQDIEGRQIKWSANYTEWMKMGYRMPDYPDTVLDKILSVTENDLKKAKKNIEQSFSLDEYSSKKELIKSATKYNNKKKMLSYVRVLLNGLRLIFRRKRRVQE